MDTPSMNTSNPISRRRFLKSAALTAGVLGVSAPAQPPTATPNNHFMDIVRPPHQVFITSTADTRELSRSNTGTWEMSDVSLRTLPADTRLRIQLTAGKTPVKRLHLVWQNDLNAWGKILNDHWERSYGDLAWEMPNPARVLPWYFMVCDGPSTHGYGVMTAPGAFCYWKTAADGLHLFADVRCGGNGVILSGRTLDVCTILCRQGAPSESPFAATRAFCAQMCPQPRLASHRVFGTNDWYYTYGAGDSAAEIVKDAQFIASLTPSGPNRPYTLIDAGWHITGGCDEGPWDAGNDRFPSMPGLAQDIVKAGARPAIWIRPLGAAKSLPAEWRLSRDAKYLDPTVPDARRAVAQDIARLREWGYQIIKQDFTTFDLLGRWGFQMGEEITSEPWAFAQPGLTTAEVILDLYRTIREAAGDALVIGCNTISHLSAGLFELNRIGDDTSGKEWDRTRKMGVNCLAFRAPQHNTFYAADADCIGLTTAEIIPWTKNRQWLDLLARSGTPLFISVNRNAIGPEQEKDLRNALAIAAQPQPIPEALDWMDTRLPRQWKLMGETVTYDWT